MVDKVVLKNLEDFKAAYHKNDTTKGATLLATLQVGSQTFRLGFLTADKGYVKISSKRLFV
jgi:hypothetical protein